MGPEDEQGHGAADDPEDDGPGAPWLPPDDRLWRHPSEVFANSGAGSNGLVAVAARWVRRAEARIWLVGVLSGVVGALVGAGVLVVAGATGEAPAPVRTSVSSTPIVHVKGPSSSDDFPADVTATLDIVEPSIVGVTVDGAQGLATGSGVIVNMTGDECYVLTDSSLFSEAGPSSQVQVVSYWANVRTAYLVGTDQSSGLALVKFTTLPFVTTAELGSVADIETGEEVFSVGSQWVAGSSNGSNFAFGYINDNASYLQPDNGASNAMFSMLVADMTVGTSSYGGALVDASGEVLGITNPVNGQESEAGLTYVTPIDTAMADVTSMIKDGQLAPHPWLGILQATDVRVSGPGVQRLGVSSAVQVDSVGSGSPAARVGIADNDIVTTVGGRAISSVGALIAWLSDARPGEVVDIGWVHDGRSHKSDITLGTQPASANPS
jgi:S1-C subfamily serine protease